MSNFSGTYGQTGIPGTAITLGPNSTAVYPGTTTTTPGTFIGGWQTQTTPYFTSPTREDYFRQFNEARLATDRLELILKLFKEKKIDMEEAITFIQTDKSFHPK